MFVISGISKQWRVWRYPRGNQQYIYKVQHVLFALFLFVYVQWRPTLIVLCFCFVCFRLVYPMLLLISYWTKVIPSNVLRSPPWLGWPLWNICVTNDHGYVPPVVNTSRSFPHSWLITGFVARLTHRVSLVEQEQLTLPEHVSSSPVFSGVCVTRSAVLCVCFLSFCTFHFGHCVVCTSSIYRFSLPLSYLQTPFTTFSGLSIFNCLFCIS